MLDSIILVLALQQQDPVTVHAPIYAPVTAVPGPALGAAARHTWHERHLAHEAHLRRLAELAWLRAHPPPVVTVTAADVPAGGSYGHPYYCGDGDRDGWDVPCGHTAPAPVGYHASSPVNVTYTGGSGYQACVIARESGGNSQVWNASGHYGLYQFSSGTWTAAGGNPADFGHASVAEQNAVFASAYAKWGTQPWTPSDGC